MPFKFVPFKDVDDFSREAEDNRRYNRSVLADGVRGVHCLEVRPVTRGERLDYEQFAPFGSMLTSVEVYANGAMNFFVRTKLEYKPIGVIVVRPMIPYNAELEYKTLTD